MKMTKKRKNIVPVFKSRQEEARFWNEHSPLDFPDYWRDEEVVVQKHLRHEVVLSVRLDEDTLKKLEELAGRRHVGKSTLARMLIIEGLERSDDESG